MLASFVEHLTVSRAVFQAVDTGVNKAEKGLEFRKADRFSPWDRGLQRWGGWSKQASVGKMMGRAARLETLVFILQALGATGSRRAEKGHS